MAIGFRVPSGVAVLPGVCDLPRWRGMQQRAPHRLGRRRIADRRMLQENRRERWRERRAPLHQHQRRGRGRRGGPNGGYVVLRREWGFFAAATSEPKVGAPCHSAGLFLMPVLGRLPERALFKK